MHRVLLLALLVVTTHAHICLVMPHQRGALDIQDGGDPSCFRHGAPCGGMPSGPVMATLPSGRSYEIFWQQNYNHYTVGFPGYMDVAWANGPNPADSDFQLLGTISDYNPHWQGTQKNFSLAVTIPNITCDACVIRARYVAHKPGEQIFYQCADVAFSPHVPVPPSDSDSALTVTSRSPPRSSADGNYLVALNPTDESTVQLLQIDPLAGSTNVLLTIPLTVRLSSMARTRGNISTDPFTLDQIAAVDQQTQTVYFMASDGGLESVPRVLLAIQPSSMLVKHIPLPSLTSPINSLTWDASTNTLIALSMEASSNPGFFITHILRVDPQDGSITHLLDTQADDTYINLQWTVVDEVNQLFYILFQNENAADSMDSIIITIDLKQNAVVKSVELDVSQFTIAVIHLDYLFNSGELLSFSPGLTQGPDAWNLVSVNPTTGAITYIRPITTSGLFDRYYGGSVFDGARAGSVVHTLRSNNAFSVVVFTSNTTTFSPPISYPSMHNRIWIH